MGNVERSKQIQHDKIEPIRSSSRRGFSLEVILHFFDGGSSISTEFDEGFIIPVDDTDVSVLSDGKLVISDDDVCDGSLYIAVVAMSAIEKQWVIERK